MALFKINKFKKMVNIKLVPSGKGENENLNKAVLIAEDRNKEIAKILKVPVNENLTFAYYQSAGFISGKIGSPERVFMGYVDHSDEVLLIHPDGGDGLFTDLWDEMKLITDYVLIKYYLCQKYYKNPEDFKLYYKYLSDSLASIISGKYQDSVAKFEFKMYTPGKKLKKDTEIGLILYIMKTFSGVDFIVDNLDKIFEDRKISQTINSIYNKSLDELILPLKEKVIEEERVQRELEKQKRQQQFNQTQNAQRPGNSQGKFVTRDKFKSKENNKDNTSSENRSNDSRRNNFNNKDRNNNHNNNNRQNSKNFDNKPRKNNYSKDREKYEKATIDPSKI